MKTVKEQPMDDKMEPNTVLGRRMGKLVNRRVVEVDGKTAFECECDCGNWRTVGRKVFNAGTVTCCEECVAKGERPPTPQTMPVRRSVSLDADALAVLGVDLSISANVSGGIVRQLLREYSWAVADTNDVLPLSEDEWEALRRAVRKHPNLLTDDLPPKTKLIRIIEEAGGEYPDDLNHCTPMEVLTALAALRWAVDHPKAKGQWWRVEERTEDE